MFFSTFVTQEGVAATITGTPTITIRHKAGDNIITDVNSQNMTVMPDYSSTYYYLHSFGASAFRGSYTAIYEATYSTGENVIYSDDFRVVDKDGFSSRSGGFTSKIIQVFSKEDKDKLIKAAQRVDEMAGTITKKEEIDEIKKIQMILSERVKDESSIELLAKKLDENRKALKGEMYTLYDKLRNIGVQGEDLEYLIHKNLSDDALEEVINERGITSKRIQQKERKSKERARTS